MNKKQRGFTLLEVLLVIALIAILAGITIVAINPAKQLAAGRDVQRKSDVSTILNAIYQYSLDNSGDLSGLSLPSLAACSATATAYATCTGTATNEICLTGGTCTNLVDLSDLTDDGLYLTSMPVDPQDDGGNGVGYFVCQDSSTDRITVCATTDSYTGSTGVYATK